MIETDVAIIGAGPVGLFAVFQCGMLKIKCHVIDALDMIGGQCQALYPEKPIYDIPAYPQISGEDLIKQLEAQIAPFNPTFHLGQQVTELTQQGESWALKTSKGTEIRAKAVIIAAGAGAFGPNKPPLEGLETYEDQGSGVGIHYLVRKREDFRDKHLVIAGGGDSAVDWALSLSELAASVKLVHRRAKFRAAPESLDQLKKLADQGKVELVTPYQLHSLDGEDGQLKAVIVQDLDGQERRLAADAMLPFYGLSMQLGPIADWELGLAHNHISVVPATMQTSRPGIFAVGDIATYDGKLKLILQGFSEAAQAAHAIHPLIFPGEALHFEYSTSKGVTS